jgi:hypothetical protein
MCDIHIYRALIVFWPCVPVVPLVGWPQSPAQQASCTLCPAGWAAAEGEHIITFSTPFGVSSQSFVCLRTSMACLRVQSTPQRATCVRLARSLARCVTAAMLHVFPRCTLCGLNSAARLNVYLAEGHSFHMLPVLCLCKQCCAGAVAHLPLLRSRHLCLLVGFILLQELHYGHLCSNG